MFILKACVRILGLQKAPGMHFVCVSSDLLELPYQFSAKRMCLYRSYKKTPVQLPLVKTQQPIEEVSEIHINGVWSDQ